MSAPDDETSNFEGTDNEKTAEDELDRLSGQMEQLTKEERKLKDVLESIKRLTSRPSTQERDGARQA